MTPVVGALNLDGNPGFEAGTTVGWSGLGPTGLVQRNGEVSRLASGVPATFLPAGLVASWSAEGDGREATGNYPGTLGAGVAFSAGVLGTGFQFDGSGDGVRVKSTKTGLNLTSAWTLSAWVRPRLPGVDARQDPLVWKSANDRFNRDTYYLGWEVALAGAGAKTQGRFVAGLERASDDASFDVFSKPHPPGVIYHVVASYDGSVLQVVVDGTVESKRTIGKMTAYVGSDDFRIGSVRGTSHGNAGTFRGLIDEVAVFNRALSDQEVVALHQSYLDLRDSGGGGEAPSAPKPRIDQVDHSSITLSWPAVDRPVAATNYVVSRASTSGGPFVKIGETTEPLYRDTNLPAATSYCYAVSSVATNGQSSAYSSAVCGATVPHSSTTNDVSAASFTVLDLLVPASGGFAATAAADSLHYFRLLAGDHVTAIDQVVDVGWTDQTRIQLVDPDVSMHRPSRFYRIQRVTRAEPLDSDGDGIHDVYELGMKAGLHPLRANDAALDPDNDGRTTFQEFVAGTNPFESDIVATSFRLTGKVLDSDGRPVAGAVVSVYDLEVPSVSTDDTGIFEFQAMPLASRAVGLEVVGEKGGQILLAGRSITASGGGTVDLGDIRAESLSVSGPMVFGSDSQTLALQRDGRLWKSQPTNPPVQVGFSAEWRAVVGPAQSGGTPLGLRSDGGLWVLNGTGPEGAVLALPGSALERGWRTLYSNGDHQLGIRDDGRLWAWGNNRSGQLGIPLRTQRTSTPTNIFADYRWRTAAAVSGSYSLGIRLDGTLWAWGQVPPGSPADAPIRLIRIGGAAGWIQAMEGLSGEDLALRGDGSLWRLRVSGILGLSSGEITNALTPLFLGRVWRSIGALAGIQTDGSLWRWSSFSDEPERVGDGTNWNEVVSGRAGSVRALRADGTLWAWGPGNLGNGSVETANVPTQIAGGSKWRAVAAGRFHSAALADDGRLWVGGANEQGALGLGTIGGRFGFQPLGVETNWVSLAAGLYQTLGIKTDGTLWSWGARVPVPTMIGEGQRWRLASAGIGGSLAIREEGTVWYWPASRSTNGTMGSPVQIGTASDWVSVTAGNSGGAGLRANGSLWTWRNTDSPTQVMPGSRWKYIGLGGSQSPQSYCAVREDGRLFGWGRSVYSGFEALGWNESPTPAPLTGGIQTSWASVAVSLVSDRIVGILKDGSLWGWGLDRYLGAGPSTGTIPGLPGIPTPIVYPPKRIGDRVGWRQVVLGQNHSLAMGEDGSLSSWGSNGDGQLLLPPTFVPAPVPGNNWGLAAN